ncbi:hypothetical protein BDV12DRAFT_15935 [Aspergillus spectabilis]
MARGPGMSKGCAVCRRRKIKCDRKYPSCSQCIRHKTQCYGTVHGNVFLGTSLDTSSGRLKKIRVEEDNTRGENSTSYESAASLGTLSPVIQSIELLKDQLLATFRSFFAKSAVNKAKSSGWMSMVLDREPRLRWPALAAALALYSKQRGGLRSEEQARKWYGYGLKTQQETLVDGCVTLIGAKDVSGAVLLAYYEFISPTSKTGHFQHILGAQALLLLIGPHACREGHLHQLLQTVRLHMVYVSLSTTSASILGSEAWTSVPFSSLEKSRLDRMVDFLLRFPSNLQHLDSIKSHAAVVEEVTIRFVVSLIPMWKMLFLANKPQTSPCMSPIESRKLDLHATHLFRYIPWHFLEEDSESVMAVALYSLAWILLLSRNEIRPLGVPDCDPLLVAHCNVILRAAVCMEAFNDGCGYVRMVYPLKCVLFKSPDFVQRGSAAYRLRSWATAKGLAGIWTLDISSVSEHQSLPVESAGICV